MWEEWLRDIVVYAGTNPWQFLYYILLCLSPLFALSAYFSWQLAQQIDAKEKRAKKTSQRQANKAKLRKHDKND
jgi:hypothetical protein